MGRGQAQPRGGMGCPSFIAQGEAQGAAVEDVEGEADDGRAAGASHGAGA